MNPSFTPIQCELEAKNVFSNRISNIAITIDKVKHCLKMMGTNDPPLRSLSYKEIFSKFADGELSFRASLFKLIDKLEECDEKPEISRLFWKVADISVTNDTSEQDARERYQKVLGIMKELSEKIRKFESKVVFTDALADSLYMFSCTYTYFCQTESYKKFTGDEVEVRR